MYNFFYSGKNIITKFFLRFKMKKILLLFIAVGILFSALLFNFSTENKYDYVRIHIRANSNEEADQNVKMLVKDKIVDYLTPILSDVKSKQECMALIDDNIDKLENLADSVLYANGYAYKSTISLRKEEFPIRKYDDIVLDSGIYDALIVELGSGKGDNWWCIVYPPFCFSVTGDEEEIIYKSRIVEKLKELLNQ